MPIGRAIVNALAYVDDLLAVNNNVVDANNGHHKVCFFADKRDHQSSKGWKVSYDVILLNLHPNTLKQFALNNDV